MQITCTANGCCYRRHRLSFARRYEALQSWGILACIGVITGLLAAAVDIGVAWFADIKLGYCSHTFWIPRYKCCIASMNYFSCPEWRSWSEHLGFERGSALGGMADFLVFVGSAVAFATLAAYLVASWSLLAAGDGIPEAKTFAGGFGIPGHLSKTTLVTKACAVVLAVSRSDSVAASRHGPSATHCKRGRNDSIRAFAGCGSVPSEGTVGRLAAPD